jgi:predicted GH43/DUF377 family glycosyl hydrolase
MLERSAHNPILTARPDLSWCSKKVYNCAVVKDGSVYRMLFRAVGDDWVSRLGLAESEDGVSFTIASPPVLAPSYQWEANGCEDPRMVKIDGTYYVTYTAYDGTTARAALTSSTNLKVWDERRLLFPNLDNLQREDFPTDWSKAAAIYPQKINNKYYLFFGDNHIWAAVSDDLVSWEPLLQPVLSSRDGYFDSAYVEMGPPPIDTPQGWLVLYHGIDRFDNQRTYSLGAALFDKDDPLRLIWRSQTPILEPTESYEVIGMIDIISGGFDTLKTMGMDDMQKLAAEHQLPRAIFCCAAILENDDTVRLYYSGGDTVICTAAIDLESILAA